MELLQIAIAEGDTVDIHYYSARIKEQMESMMLATQPDEQHIRRAA